MPQMGYSATPDAHSYSMDNTELGIKYRLTPEPESETDWMVSLYPFYELSSGNASRMLGVGSSSTYLPLWVQTTRGNWTTYGGGGYWINPGAGRKNAWAAGWVTLYQFTPHLQLGWELFAQTAATVDGRGASGFNLGGSYGLGKDYSLLFSVGQGLSNVAVTNKGSIYLGLQKIY